MNSRHVTSALLGLAAFLAIAALAVSETQKRQAFMIECQDDNMKHYQCVSLWNGGGLAIFRNRNIPLDVN